MTGRERLQAVLRKQATDRLPWTTLVDQVTLSLLPDTLRGHGGIDFYNHLGCDVFLLNGWNTPHHFRAPELRWSDNVRITTQWENGQSTTRWSTPRGTLTAIRQGSHPLKYPVTCRTDLHIYRDMWDGAEFVAHDDSASFARLENIIGNQGVVTRFWGPSTIPRLLESDMGTEHFYYLMADHPEDMNALIHRMHQRELDAFKILANGPWDSVTLVENTSTYYISPDIYRRYNMPHQRDFVDICHARNKTALLHMCGHIRGLLDLIKETRCDGIHTLTPPPTGDTPWEAALDALGDDLVIFGCLDPSIFITGSLHAIPEALDRLVTPRLREANFVLNPMADGIAVDPERFYAVADWINS